MKTEVVKGKVKIHEFGFIVHGPVNSTIEINNVEHVIKKAGHLPKKDIYQIEV